MMTRSKSTLKRITTNTVRDPINMTSLHDDLNQSLKLNEQLLREQEEYESDYRKLLEQNSNLKKQLAALESKLLTVSKENNDYKCLLHNFEGEYRTYEDTMTKVESQEKAIRELEDLLKESREKHIKDDKDLEKKENNLKSELVELRKENVKLQNFILETNRKQDTHINVKNCDMEDKINYLQTELTQVKSELKLKRNELKTIKKKMTINDKKAKAEFSELEKLHGTILEKHKNNLTLFEDTKLQLQSKIDNLEQICRHLRDMYDNRSIEMYNANFNKTLDSEILDEIENILKQDNLDGDKVLKTENTLKFVNPEKDKQDVPNDTTKRKILRILGDDITVGLGTLLNKRIQSNWDICCHSMTNACTNHIINKAIETVESEKELKCLIVLVANININAKSFMNRIFQLRAMTEVKGIDLILNNIPYTQGLTTESVKLNNTKYMVNCRFHTGSVYSTNLSIIDLNSSGFNRSTRKYQKTTILNYIQDLCNIQKAKQQDIVSQTWQTAGLGVSQTSVPNRGFLSGNQPSSSRDAKAVSQDFQSRGNHPTAS